MAALGIYSGYSGVCNGVCLSHGTLAVAVANKNCGSDFKSIGNCFGHVYRSGLLHEYGLVDGDR